MPDALVGSTGGWSDCGQPRVGVGELDIARLTEVVELVGRFVHAERRDAASRDQLAAFARELIDSWNARSTQSDVVVRKGRSMADYPHLAWTGCLRAPRR